MLDINDIIVKIPIKFYNFSYISSFIIELINYTIIYIFA